MQRIQDPTAVASEPASPALTGPAGYFAGSLTSATVTRVRAWWLNMIQEELAAIVTAAGMPLDGSQTVLAAIEALFQRSLGFTPVQQGGGPNQAGNKVYVGWDTGAAGVRIAIDGADQGIYLPKSYTDARDQAILSSANTYAAGSYDTATKAFPGGYIIKNGISTTNGGIQDFIAFPVAFPNNCLAVVCVEDNAQPSWGHNSSPTIYGVTARQAGGFYISCEVFVSGGFVPGPGQGFNYIAVGY